MLAGDAAELRTLVASVIHASTLMFEEAEPGRAVVSQISP